MSDVVAADKQLRASDAADHDPASSEGEDARVAIAHRRRFSTTWRRLRPDLGAIVIGLAVVLLALFVVYDLGGVHPRVPIVYSGDTNLAMGAIRNIQLHGWFVETPQLGAPYGQDLHDYPPVGDAAHVLELTALGSLFDSPGLVLNVFFFGSFMSVFLGAYIGARMLMVSRIAAVVIAVLYAFLPYHWQHGPGHLFLSSYFAVPLWVALFARQLGEHPVIPPLAATRAWREWWAWLRTPAVVGAAVISILATTTGLYYGVFFVLIGGLVAVILAATAKSWRRGLTMAPFIGGGFLVLAAQYLPVAAYHERHGSNDIVARGVNSIEFYSLKLSDMLLPVRGHRIDALSQWQADAQQVLLIGERTEALGFVGALGLLALFGTVLIRALRGDPAGRLGPLAVVATIAFLLGTTGGISMIIGVVGDLTELRAWSRISVVIAFCALVAAGMAFDVLRARFARRALVAVLAAAAIVTIGVADMTPTHVMPNYDVTANRWGVDRDFVGGVERALGGDASVFQLPVVPYPENPPVNHMTDYDHLRGYLHSDSLSWSYGGVKGREDAWQQRLADLPLDEQPDAIVLAGFDGVWLDRAGYLEPDRVAIEAALTDAFGRPVLVDHFSRLALYDTAGRRAELDARLSEAELEERAAAITDRTRIEYGDGFSGVETAPDGTFAWAEGDRAELRVESFDASGAPARVRFSAGSAVAGQHRLIVRAPGIEASYPITTDGTVVEFEISVPDDGVEIELWTDAPRLDEPSDPRDPRDLRFRVYEPTAALVDP
ncbi:MAG: hypothetical protein ACT4OX_02925 [Actinomycetota bacterium]